MRVRSASTPGRSSTSTTTTSRSRVTATWEIASECLAASACGTRMWSSARSPGPTHVAAAMFTPASLIAAATCASAPGVFSMSMTRSTAMSRAASAYAGAPVRARRLVEHELAQAHALRCRLDALVLPQELERLVERQRAVGYEAHEHVGG